MTGLPPGTHTTPVLVFDTDDGIRCVRRREPDGELSVFVHAIPGAAIFTLPPGDDRQLLADDLMLVTGYLRRFSSPKSELPTPIVTYDGLPMEIGEQREITTPDPMGGYRFRWGHRSCALLTTQKVDPMLNCIVGQVITFDPEWTPPKKGIMDRLLGRFFNE